MKEEVYVCIGNGVRADGSPSAPSKAVVVLLLSSFLRKPMRPLPIVVFSGGYRSPGGVTEAGAMMAYLESLYPAYGRFLRGQNLIAVENRSYRTHNNAIEALKIIVKKASPHATVVICDHPLHLPRTLLAFTAVMRCRYGHLRPFPLVSLPSEEVYDAEIPGQSQWQNKKTFAAHERKGMLLYSILLSWPWARFGLWLLTKLWPNEKQ